MAALRSALRRLAPAARLLSRGSSGPSVAARRNFFTGSEGRWTFLGREFSLNSPETWFAGIAILVGATYRIKVQKYPEEWKEASSSTILKDSDTACGQLE